MKVVAGRGPYFAQIPFTLLDDPNTDGFTIATYCALRRFADFGADSGCFASHRTLAVVAGISEKALRDRIQWLANAGWVTWESGAATGKTNRYTIHASLEGSVAATEGVGRAYRGGRSQKPRGVGSRHRQPKDSSTRETTTETSKPAAWVRTLAEDWGNIYGGIPNYGELGKRLKPLVEQHGFEPVQERWQHYLEATEGRYASPSRFAQTYGSWDRAGGAPAQEARISPEDARVAFRAAGIPDSWALNPDGYWSRDELERAVAVRVAKLRNGEGAPQPEIRVTPELAHAIRESIV